MKATIVDLVTPHVLRVIDLAEQAEKAVNVGWHLRNTGAKSIDDPGHRYNARDLLSAYQHGLETSAQQAGRGRHFYGNALKAAAAIVTRALSGRGCCVCPK